MDTMLLFFLLANAQADCIIPPAGAPVFFESPVAFSVLPAEGPVAVSTIHGVILTSKETGEEIRPLRVEPLVQTLEANIELWTLPPRAPGDVWRVDSDLGSLELTATDIDFPPPPNLTLHGVSLAPARGCEPATTTLDFEAPSILNDMFAVEVQQADSPEFDGDVSHAWVRETSVHTVPGHPYVRIRAWMPGHAPAPWSEVVGCGCGSAPGGWGWPGLALLLAFLRRQRGVSEIV